MRFKIDHQTRYRYSRRVSLGNHLLRLVPRCDAHQQLLQFKSTILPEPVKQSDFIDAWGNAATLVEFTGDTDRLEIGVEMLVETRTAALGTDVNDGRRLCVPPDYGSDAAALQPYLETGHSDKVLEDFIRGVSEQADGQLPEMLNLLNQRVARFHSHSVRLEGAARTPAETIQKKAGVCRDLAWLFISACRQLGIAARFVSGYQKQPAHAQRDERYLHAWAEVYVPDTGWQGYDQTHGLPVANEHVVVACGATQAVTMPVEGSFSFDGKAPRTTLETKVRIDTLDND